MVRLAIVGFGGMARGMLRGAKRLQGGRFVAVCEPREESRQEAEEEHDLQAFADLEELLDAEAADAVYVATPNKFHAPVTIRCLEAGLHVFCEKPIALNADEGRQMIDAADRTGRKLTVNLSFRQTGAARALKQIADSGDLGDIYFARTGWVRNRGIPMGSGWFADRELAGGGPLIDLGIHRIDLALWLMGHPEPVTVSGSTYDLLGRRICEGRAQTFSVEDLAVGFVRLETGAALQIAVSWAANSEWAEDMYTYIYGTKAGAAHRHVGGTYEFEARLWGDVGGGYGETVLKKLPRDSSHLQDFVDAVRDDGPVPVDPRDALKVQKIIDALYLSATEGREVRLDGPPTASR
jgi:predicted dehydrogenase